MNPHSPPKLPYGKIAAGGIIALLAAAVLIPQEEPYETYCTPRTPPGQEVNAFPPPQPAPGDEIISQTETETCYRRTPTGEDGFGK